MIMPFNIICIDLETTDINPEKGSVIQLSGIVVNQHFEQMFAREFDSFVKPLDNYRNQQAMSVNHISEEDLNSAPSLEEVLIMFESFCDKDKVLASWGSYFDIPFLKKQYEKINKKWTFGYKTLDLKTIGIWESSKKDLGIIKGCLSEFIEMNGGSFKGTKHNSLDDIKNTVNLIKSFI